VKEIGESILEWINELSAVVRRDGISYSIGRWVLEFIEDFFSPRRR
jgi:hypothetical protein